MAITSKDIVRNTIPQYPRLTNRDIARGAVTSAVNAGATRKTPSIGTMSSSDFNKWLAATKASTAANMALANYRPQEVYAPNYDL